MKVGMFIRLEAKQGQEEALKTFLENTLPSVQAETTTPVWFAVRFGHASFGIFDAFEDDTGRQAHMRGKVAMSLMMKASELLAGMPKLEAIDVLAAKVSG
jgi:quinol monooxygenase YgiN